MTTANEENKAFDIKVGFDRKLVWIKGESVRYLIAEVKAQEVITPREPVSAKPLNLALVIDASGSMRGPKLPAAKNAVLGVSAGLGPEDYLSVVSFASEIKVHLADVAMDAAGRQRVKNAVEPMETRDSTDLGGGWLKGAECIAECMERSAKGLMLNRVVVLSDGQANRGITDPEELQEHASRLRTLGIMTSTVGIGDDYDATLMQVLAEYGGGRMHDAEHAAEIGEVLLGELRDSRHSAVDNLTLSLTVPAQVRCVPLGGLPVESGGGTHRVVLGSMTSGAVRKVVFKLICPSGDPGEELRFVLEATGQKAGSDQPQTCPLLEANLTFAEAGRNTGQPRDIDAANAVAIIWHAHVVRLVARMNRSRERREARGYLERELKWFERYCRDLPGAQSLVEEMARMFKHVDRDWDERTRKEMEHGSYKTSRSERDYRSSARRHWSDRLDDQ